MFAIKLLVGSFFLTAVSARVINPDLPDFYNGHKPKHQPIGMANCRTNCIGNFVSDDHNSTAKDDACLVNQPCLMCWDYCGMLYKDYIPVMDRMCSDNVCRVGCQIACLYYYNLRYQQHSRHTRSINEEDNQESESIEDVSEEDKDYGENDDENDEEYTSQLEQTEAIFLKNNKVLLPKVPHNSDSVFIIYGVTSTGLWIEETKSRVPTFTVTDNYTHFVVQVISSTGIDNTFSFCRYGMSNFMILTTKTVLVIVLISLILIAFACIVYICTRTKKLQSEKFPVEYIVLPFN